MTRAKFKKLFIVPLEALIIFFLSSTFFAGQWYSNDFSAQNIRPVLQTGPTSVTIIGMFPPAQGTVKRGLAKVTVVIHKVRKDFIIQDLWPREWNTGTLETLNQIIPPVLRFYGPEDILQDLLKPGTEGKVLRMVGDLYLSNGIFLVDYKEEQTKG
jgi:hypothetical protein